MPASRIPITFAPTSSRSSSKSSSSSSSTKTKLSKRARFPPAYSSGPFALATNRRSLGTNSSEGSTSRSGSPSASSVSGGGGRDGSGGGLEGNKEGSVRRGSKSAGGVACLPSILISCTHPPTDLANDRYSPPVYIPYIPSPAPKLFPSSNPTPSRRATADATTGRITRAASGAAGARPTGVFRRNTTGSVNVPAKPSLKKTVVSVSGAGGGAGGADKPPTSSSNLKKKRKSGLSAETTSVMGGGGSSRRMEGGSALESTSSVSPTSSSALSPSSTHTSNSLPPSVSVKPPPTQRRPSNLSSEITDLIANPPPSSPPPSSEPATLKPLPSMTSVVVEASSSPITLHSTGDSAAAGVQLVAEGGSLVGRVRV